MALGLGDYGYYDTAMRSFLSELKRRSVFKVAVAYAIVAWLLAQVAQVIESALSLPAQFDTIVIVTLGLGFPIAVILAWAYDLTPEGVKLTPPMPPQPASELAAVAVLPFENLTPSHPNSFLPEAISSELRSSLLRIHKLRVVPTQTAMAQSQTTKSLKAIAEELDVQYVISGNVTQTGEEVCVMAELCDAINDSLLWSKRFEIESGRILEIQHEIAERVAIEFGGEKLRLELKRVREMAPTKLSAWELVQKARGYLLDYTAETVAAEVPLLERAVQIDPDYAIAHASLGLAVAERTLNGISRDASADRASALASVKRAETLAPKDSVVLRAAGAVHAYCGDNLRSIKLLRRAVALAPYDMGAWGYLGWPLVATGQREDLRELHETLNRLFAIAPNHPGQAYWLFHKSVAHSCEGDLESALEYSERSTAEQPRFALAWMHGANVYGRLGRLESAREAAARSVEVNSRFTVGYYVELMSVLSGNPDVVETRTAGVRAAGLVNELAV